MSRTKQPLTVLKKQRDLALRVAAVQALGKTSCPRCQAPYDRGRFSRPYFVCASCGHRWSLNPVVDALASHLDVMHRRKPWDWFGTFTTARLLSPDGGQYWIRRYLGWVEEEGLCKPYSFTADEFGPLNGRFHMHALIGNVRHLRHYCGDLLPPGTWGKRCCWMHRWPLGFARIVPFDPELGAIFYLTKYVAKRLGNYDFLGFAEHDFAEEERNRVKRLQNVGHSPTDFRLEPIERCHRCGNPAEFSLGSEVRMLAVAARSDLDFLLCRKCLEFFNDEFKPKLLRRSGRSSFR